MTSRTQTGSGFAQAFANLYQGFCKLSEKQFAAPWRPERTRDC
jgi:hypothetical protein